MAKDALGKELEVGQIVLYATSMSSQLYKGKVKKVCGKMVILDTKHEQRKFHESVVIVSDSYIDLKEDQVAISRNTLYELQTAKEHMDILEILGVDNWEGYVSRECVDTFCFICCGDINDCECVKNE